MRCHANLGTLWRFTIKTLLYLEHCTGVAALRETLNCIKYIFFSYYKNTWVLKKKKGYFALNIPLRSRLSLTFSIGFILVCFGVHFDQYIWGGKVCAVLLGCTLDWWCVMGNNTAHCITDTENSDHTTDERRTENGRRATSRVDSTSWHLSEGLLRVPFLLRRSSFT